MIEKLMDFINDVVEENTKYGMETILDVDFLFFCGYVHVSIDPCEIVSDYFEENLVINFNSDNTEGSLTIPVTKETVMYIIDKNRFTISNVDIPGILDKKIYFAVNRR